MTGCMYCKRFSR